MVQIRSLSSLVFENKSPRLIPVTKIFLLPIKIYTHAKLSRHELQQQSLHLQSPTTQRYTKYANYYWREYLHAATLFCLYSNTARHADTYHSHIDRCLTGAWQVSDRCVLTYEDSVLLSSKPQLTQRLDSLVHTVRSYDDTTLQQEVGGAWRGSQWRFTHLKIQSNNKYHNNKYM